MKKIFATLLILTFCIYGISEAKETGYITVQQSDYIEIEPNMAEMTISIETSDNNLEKAATENKNNAQKVYKALSAILEDGDYLKTGSYIITPKHTKIEGKRVFDTYIVTNSISLKTSNLAAISKILDTAVEQGANHINNLKLTISNYDEIENDLLTKLTKKALEKANAIAKSANTTVTGIKNLNADCNTQDNQPRGYSMSLAKNANTDTNSTPFEKGKIKIYGNVYGSFYVK